MSFLEFFLSRKKNTAQIAKKRLQIIIKNNTNNINYCKYFVNLKKELFFVIEKYIKITPKIFNVQINQKIPNTLVIKLHRIQKKDHNIY
ncbi:cell division topological specificity factor MinE [Buchnera aphidicola]|uniref:cell division topological specificity factor MinE n=1 Tax=Buchnera aphidicola TaxID=9 RepID=UPI0034647BC0